MKRISYFITGAVALVLVAALVMSRTNNSQSSGKNQIIATFYPYAYLAQRIVGSRMEVINLTPPGAEPHDFEPSTRDLARVQAGKLLIMNGYGVEAYEVKLKTLLKGSNVDIYIAGDKYANLKIVKEGKTRVDPHIWLDPKVYIQVTQDVLQKIIKLDSVHSEEYKANAAALIRDMEKIDASYKTSLADCRLKTIITSHTAFGYLAARYGLEQIGITGISPDEEPSPKELVAISGLVNEKGIRYIMLEELAPKELGEVVARETGAQLLVLDPSEGLTPEEEKSGKSYLSKQYGNITSLKLALDCK